MDPILVKQEIYHLSKRLDNAPKGIHKAAKEFAEAERAYRKALSIEIMTLKANGLQATLIPDVARGNCSDLKYERDLKEGLYKSAIESSRVLQSEMSGLQSILRTEEESYATSSKTTA